MEGNVPIQCLKVHAKYCLLHPTLFCCSKSHIGAINISHNFLTLFPNLFANNVPYYSLRLLTQLDLSNNQICKLDDDLFNHLPKLMLLNLSINQLVDLPASLCQLHQLKSLHVQHNKLHRLPHSVMYLIHLVDLQCQQDALMWPPAYIVQQGCKSIMQFIKNAGLVKYVNQSTLSDLQIDLHDENDGYLGSLYAHAVVLVSRFPVLARFITGDRLKMKKTGIEECRLFLEFIYTDTLDIFSLYQSYDGDLKKLQIVIKYLCICWYNFVFFSKTIELAKKIKLQRLISICNAAWEGYNNKAHYFYHTFFVQQVMYNALLLWSELNCAAFYKVEKYADITLQLKTGIQICIVTI